MYRPFPFGFRLFAGPQHWQEDCGVRTELTLGATCFQSDGGPLVCFADNDSISQKHVAVFFAAGWRRRSDRD